MFTDALFGVRYLGTAFQSGDKSPHSKNEPQMTQIFLAPLCSSWRLCVFSWRPWRPSLRLGVAPRLCAPKNADYADGADDTDFLCAFVFSLGALGVPLGALGVSQRLNANCRLHKRQSTAPPCRVLPSFAPACAGGCRPGQFRLGSGLSRPCPRDWLPLDEVLGQNRSLRHHAHGRAIHLYHDFLLLGRVIFTTGALKCCR